MRVLATDVSRRALTAAEAGRYGERAFVMTDPIDRQRFFYLDAESRSFVVRDEVRDLVEFRHHNLVTEPPPFEPGALDLALCRNVTIYFDRSTTRRLMQRLHTSLRDGGYLFLGHAETLWQVCDDFTLASLGDAFVYRRSDQPLQRRAVLPDRRTEDEPRPTRADRRRGPLDRRLATARRRRGIARRPSPRRPRLRCRLRRAQRCRSSPTRSSPCAPPLPPAATPTRRIWPRRW